MPLFFHIFAALTTPFDYRFLKIFEYAEIHISVLLPQKLTQMLVFYHEIGFLYPSLPWHLDHKMTFQTYIIQNSMMLLKKVVMRQTSFRKNSVLEAFFVGSSVQLSKDKGLDSKSSGCQ